MLASEWQGRAQRQMQGLQGVFHRVVSRVSAVTLPGPAHGADGTPIQARNITVAAITRLVQLSSRYAWPVILGFLLNPIPLIVLACLGPAKR